MAVGLPLKTTYADGDVYSASDVNDTNGTINLIGYGSPVVAGKNFVINGGFDIWQRGTSFSLAASTSMTYVADRWATTTFANEACTFSRQLTNDTTNLPNIQYCLRFQRNSGQTGTTGMPLSNAFETVNSIPLAGQTVTMSFYARAGANYSATSSILTSYIITGTGTDQNPVTAGYTGSNTSINTNNTLTTTWQRFTLTGTLPTTTTEMAAYFAFVPTGTAGANDYFEITGVQLERGVSATDFSRNTSTYQGELAACQRYYYRYKSSAVASPFGPGFADSSTVALINHKFPVIMRTAPTALEQSGTAGDYSVRRATGTNTVCNSVPVYATSDVDSANILLNFASGLTAGQGLGGRSVNTSAYFGWSAEL